MVLPERIDALVGSTLGKDYRVLQVLGTGGMAVVYLVEHQTLLKRFAAKVLSSELASSAEARERFAQEAHAASQLDHENIVTISDFGITADQRPFFVMELLRGQTLDQRLGDGPMSIEEVVAVAVPVARALAHAHAEGIVHRDVKPENIFLVQRSQGRWGVKVVDFGIAKLPINPKRTSRNETLGSPLFMAPEMIRGEDDAVDQRADVYSFGVLLYLMLCRRLPFFDDNLRKVMQMHLASPVPPPRAVNPALPEPLAQVVERALAKRADDRYPSLDSLLIEFEAALPPGADRLLIEAQSGAAAHETPFAQTLAIARESPRITPSEPALRTMRVSPLPSPSAVLPVTPLRSPPPRRIGIVLTSALVTGLLGIVAYGKLAGRAHRPVTGGARGELVAARPVPVPAPAPAPGREAPAPAPSPAATPPPGEPAAEPAAEPAPSEHPIVTSRRPVTRPKAPPRREPPRPGRRVAIAAAPGGPPRTAPAAPAAEPPPSPPPGEPAREPPAAPAEPAPGPGDSASAPAAVGPGSLDAMPVFEHLDVRGSLASSVVKRGMERQIGSLRACYQTAARAGNATPAVDLQVSLEIDENGAATHVSTSGTGFGPLARCAASVLGGVHTQQAPDTGTAQVSVMLRFRPS